MSEWFHNATDKSQETAAGVVILFATLHSSGMQATILSLRKHR